MHTRESLARLGLAALTAVLAATLLLLQPMFSPLLPAAHAQEQFFDSGHVDAFYVTAPGGTLTLSLKEDITGHGVEHAGDDVLLVVSEEAWSSATENIPDIAAPTYFLPQTQQPGILWPGWDTQAAHEAGYTDVDLNFVEVTGPGAVFVFETAGFGEIQAITRSGSMELSSGDSINQPYPAHRHINWAFTEPGSYSMTVQASSNGDASNKVTYTWQVGEGAAAESAQLDGAANADTDSAGDAAHPAAEPHAAAGAHKNAATQPRSTAQQGQRPEPANAIPGHDAALPADFYPASEQGTMLPWGVGLAGLGMLAMGLAVARLALAKARE